MVVRLFQVHANNVVFTLFFLHKIATNYLSPSFLCYFSSLYLFFFFFFLNFLCFPIMYILNITKAIQKMSINEIKDFLFENYYKRI